jgi:SAM-dependent methyltransferase
MREADREFGRSIAASYDRHLVPLIFEPYAADLAQRLGNLRAGKLLEVAAGTGVVTRSLARALPREVAIVATDLNRPMLEFAATQMVAPRTIAWIAANALALPFASGAFDVVVCQFGVMFFPDKQAAFREALRVLSTGGRFVFNVWGPIEENDFPRAVTEALAALFPDDPPRFLPRTPHGYCDAQRIRADLAAAGFANVEIVTVERESRAASARDPAVAFCHGTPLRGEIEARVPGRLAEATDASAREVARRFGAGPVVGKLQAHVVCARR